MNVKELKALIADLPDDAEVLRVNYESDETWTDADPLLDEYELERGLVVFT